MHDETKSWCESEIGIDFHFKNIEQVLVHSLHPAGKTVCIKCLNQINDLIVKTAIDCTGNNDTINE